jgi:NADP-dependent 3-hydroxy acid dehydrogenase YdfG
VGRRQENLDSFVREYGTAKAAAFQFDISKLDDIAAFAKRCVVRRA